MTLSTTDTITELALELPGRVTRPGDPLWDTARRPWQLAVDQRPAAVVEARSAQDVVATVAFARRQGYRISAQSTGHNPGPLGDLSQTILVSTAAMRDVTIDASRMIARAGGGARWEDVTAPASAAGLAALAGSAPDVGVAGYTLGGGLSWLARSHGLAANSVTALQVVTADGKIRRVTNEHDPDLFWALRGGGGSFGVVTELEFRLYPVATVHAGALFWPIQDAARVLAAWQQWTQTAPACATSVGRILRVPAMPEMPPHLSGREFVLIEAAIQESADDAAALLEPLRSLAPELDTFADIPVGELGKLHMDPPGPVPSFGDGALLAELPAAAIAEFVAATTGPGSAPLLSAELRHLGAGLAPGRAEGGAVCGFDAAFALYAVGIAPDAAAAQSVQVAVDRVLASLRPWIADEAYSNFAERPASPESLFGASLPRLSRIKAAFDPNDLFKSNHPIPLPRTVAE